MKVLFASSEVAPFAKTGGLADVSAGLPAALRELGERVSVVMPLYGQMDRLSLWLKPTGKIVSAAWDGAEYDFEVWETEGGENLFLECEELFGRPGIYGADGRDFPDNAVRFAAFSRAVLQVARTERFDLIHVNDWQAAMVPFFQMRDLAEEASGAHQAHIPTVLTIHNLAFQGLFPAEEAEKIGVGDPNSADSPCWIWEQVNFLKAGIETADWITTVSRKYSREILTPEFGCGLQDILERRSSSLSGITNGADLREWNPETDVHLPANYTSHSLAGKLVCKREVMAMTGLETSPDRPLIGMVGRLTEQKGMDLVAPGLDRIVAMGFSVVVLGTGQMEYELALQAAAIRHAGRVSAMVRYSDPVAHMIEAAADFFLMPSRFEPCGLNQIYSQIYGTPPVVHAVGGLEDTVIDPEEAGAGATGFKFHEFSSDAMLHALSRALELYRDPDRIQAMRRAGMERDFSWAASAEEYRRRYGSLRG